MGGRNRNKKAQAVLLGSHNNTVSIPPPPPISRRKAPEGRNHDNRMSSFTVRVDDSSGRQGAHQQTQLNSETFPTAGFRPWASSQYQQQRYSTRAQPRHRQRQQQRRNRQQQYPHPEAYYVQQRSNEGQIYTKRQSYQEHQQYSNQQIHQSQHSFGAQETYQEQGSYEVQHSFHEQLVVHQQQQVNQGYPSGQTGQMQSTPHSYHTQQSYYVQQCYYAQDPADPHKIYHSQHTLKGSRQLHFNAGCNEAYSKSHKFSRQFNHSVKKRIHHQSHDAPSRLDSKASTAATADGNDGLPWSWCDILEVTNSEKYLDKHKGGEGLVFQRQAEARGDKPKPTPDELDIWVNVGTVPPHIWGGRAAEDSENDEDDEEEMNGWALRLFGDETAPSQAHSLRIIRSHC